MGQLGPSHPPKGASRDYFLTLAISLADADGMSRTRAWDPGFREGAQEVAARLPEHHRRWVAGLFAQALGSVSDVAQLLGMDRKTVGRGKSEVENGLASQSSDRVRRPGAGAKLAEDKDPTLEADLLVLVEAETAGDPMTSRKWTRKSLRRLAEDLRKRGHRVGKDTVARLLKKGGTASKGIGSGSPAQPTQSATSSSATSTR